MPTDRHLGRFIVVWVDLGEPRVGIGDNVEHTCTPIEEKVPDYYQRVNQGSEVDQAIRALYADLSCPRCKFNANATGHLEDEFRDALSLAGFDIAKWITQALESFEAHDAGALQKLRMAAVEGCEKHSHRLGAVGEHVEILEKGITAEQEAIVCPNCGNDSFQEHGTMQFKQLVSLTRGQSGALKVKDYISASEPIDELSEPAGVECSQCLHACDVRGYANTSAGRRQRIAWLINGYSGASDDPESDLTDALTDICHLAVSRGFEVEKLTERALSHLRNESQQGTWVACAPDDILNVQRDAMSVTAGTSPFSTEERDERTGAIRFVVIGQGGTSKYYVVNKDGSVAERE